MYLSCEYPVEQYCHDSPLSLKVLSPGIPRIDMTSLFVDPGLICIDLACIPETDPVVEQPVIINAIKISKLKDMNFIYFFSIYFFSIYFLHITQPAGVTIPERSGGFDIPLTGLVRQFLTPHS
jgi:hypothetical protein